MSPFTMEHRIYAMINYPGIHFHRMRLYYQGKPRHARSA